MTTENPGDAVGRVIGLMYAHFDQPLTVTGLAASVRYSRFHLSREFERATGVTPGRFLRAVRQQEAKRLLLTTSMTVQEIASAVGYSSLGSFSTRFKQDVGCSPGAYRLTARSGTFPEAAILPEGASPRTDRADGGGQPPAGLEPGGPWA